MKSLALLVACCLWTSSALGKNNSQEQITRVKAYFVGKSLADIKNMLALKRPPAVSESDRKILLQDLAFVTAENRLDDRKQLDRLLSRLQGALRFHNRFGVVEIIVFNDRRPIVYNKPGVIIVLSKEVLKIVGDDDAALVGIVAHELAHEYTAMPMLCALQKKDDETIRVLELFCDAIAIVTLLSLQMEPNRYSEALEKICRHSHAAATLNDGSSTHPSLSARLRLVAEIKSLFD